MLAEPPLEKDTVLQMFSDLSNAAIPLTEGKNKIDRLGIVFQYSMSPFKNSAKELYSNILNMDLKGNTDNMNIRFALKYPISEAVYEQDKKIEKFYIEIVSDREKEIEMNCFPNSNNYQLTINFITSHQ
jgi:hypothetical protein